jgi:hypothetical protein
MCSRSILHFVFRPVWRAARVLPRAAVDSTGGAGFAGWAVDLALWVAAAPAAVRRLLPYASGTIACDFQRLTVREIQ